MINERQQ